MAAVIWILMWKHCLVRMRRFIITPCEVLSPCLFFLILFLFRNMINPQPKSQSKMFSNIHFTEPFSLDRTIVPSLILYTPDKPNANLLMDEVGRRLNLQRLTGFPAPDSRGYYAFNNEYLSALPSLIEEMKETSAFVTFQDMESEGPWPSRLNYTIRMKIDYMTHVYEALDDSIGPHQRFGTLYEPFLRLQWAVDSSYLQLATGNNVNQTIYLQEFPYKDSKTNSAIASICLLLKVVCYFSLMLPFVFLMSRLIEERASGVQELVKMVGVSNNLVTASHFLNMIPTGLVYCLSGTIFMKISSNPYIPLSNEFLIFFMLLLHFATVITMATACSYMSKTTQYAVTLSLLAYVMLWIPARLLDSRVLPRPILVLTGLFPHVPMYWFWSEVGSLEQYSKGLTFSRMFSSHTSYSRSVAICFLLMGCQLFLLCAICWYLNLVRPGKYGVGLPWNFIIKRSYWIKQKVSPDAESTSDTEEEPIVQDPRYFEKMPPNAEVGIRISNVSKVFNKNRVLTNVSFDVLKSEITVLLGHNGAGKTTLMSIITGLIPPSEGKVYVNGKDIATDADAVRQQMGLCPQHNLFFPHLTVLEHTMFFALLKNRTFAEARASSLDLLKKLGIQDKAKSQSHELSGGMKRRLQLACALSGDATVIILDEPTSGLDVETRRELWDLLLSLRGNRTVLLTTHFMEEADALGDRVAALHAGRLCCHATPMFLKKNIGTGYRLSLTTIGLPKEEAITSVVTSVVSGASLKEKSYNSMEYKLPAQESNKFPTLFSELEGNRSELMIDTIGVGVSTLEEVFLRLCSDVNTSLLDDEVDGLVQDPTYSRISGFPLFIRQMFELIKRQFRYILYRRITFAILQVILPIVLIFFFTYSVDEARINQVTNNQRTSMDLDMYRELPERRVLYNVNDTKYLRGISDSFKSVEFQTTPDVVESVLKTGEEDITEYNKYLVGVELHDSSAKVLYTTVFRHAAPVALNLLSNILAAEFMPWADGKTILTYNYPLEGAHIALDDIKMIEPKSLTGCGTWMVIVLFVIFGTLMNTISLPIKERLMGTRHIHIMMGCPPSVHWGATLLTATVVYTIVLILPTLFAALTDSQHTLDQPRFLGALFFILLLSMISFLAFAYVFSFALGERGVGLFLTLVVVLFGFIPGMVKTGADLLETDLEKWTIPLLMSSVLFPAHTATAALFRALHVARVNALCILNSNKCPSLIVTNEYAGFEIDKCCELHQDSLCYICINKFSPGKEIIILVAQIVVYMTLVVLIQRGHFDGIYDALVNRTYRPQPPKFKDEMVRAEKTYVSKAMTLPSKQISDAMLVEDVHKNYTKLFRPSNNAVKGVSFSVKRGECFGLLGVNGAGKSTTFKMITSEVCATRGNIFANGYFLKHPRAKYLESLGYCPQFFGMDEFLTGNENLTLLLTLRGLSAQGVRAEVDAWIDVVGLQKHKNKLVVGYSGGCQRRLAAAGALAGGSALALLDEPTAGVDVGARRRVWAAMRRGLKRGRSIIITSHSMDEMEALCNRITIMSGGELAALGSAAALRAQYASGHAVVIKIVHTNQMDTVDSESGLRSLKQKLHESFDCTLKDEHKTMLHYHINETMRYSELFTALEKLKMNYPHLIEDYSVTETTLEEVFLSFAQPREPKLEEV